MKRAGLIHGGFYTHFTNRDDLVAHAIDRMFADSPSLLDRHLQARDAGRGLGKFIEYYLSDAMLRALDRGCPLPGLSGIAPRLPTAARQRFSAEIVAFKAALQRSIEKLDLLWPTSLASSVSAEMVGAVARARGSRRRARARATLRASREWLKEWLELR